MKIRRLNKENWQIWKQLRLEALQNEQESFGSSYEEEQNWQDLEFQDNLNKSTIFGAFINDQLVSCIGFYTMNSLKTKHRGVIWGMYTKLEYRGKGLASLLIEAAIRHAKSSVIQIHLTCVTNNHPALKLYQKHGFQIYGTEPRALKIGDNFFDEHLLILDLLDDN